MGVDCFNSAFMIRLIVFYENTTPQNMDAGLQKKIEFVLPSKPQREEVTFDPLIQHMHAQSCPLIFFNLACFQVSFCQSRACWFAVFVLFCCVVSVHVCIPHQVILTVLPAFLTTAGHE
jgi:hypothetical protein